MNDSRAPSQTPRDGLSFIHSSLDDAGLAPAEFRVYCHVSRRAGRKGVCTESLSNIAQHCGYCPDPPDVVRAALKCLTELNMLRKNYIVGEGNEYRLTPPREWKGNALAPPRKSQRGSKKSEATPAKKSHHHPSEKVTGKGIPVEGSPMKVLKDESNKDSLASLTMNQKARQTVGLMEQCREVFGADEMKRCHARWLKRAETEPDKLRRLLADVRVTKREKQLENPGAYAETLWADVFT